MKLPVFLLLMTLPLCAKPSESRERFEAPSGKSLDYLLFEPEPALMAPDEARPLVVFLHGAGERGADLDLVRKHGPPSQFMEGDGLPFVLVAPQCPEGTWWDVDLVIGFVKAVIRERRIDPKRVHLTGLSMGGFGTWAILAKEPALFASAVPICGGGDPATAPVFKDVPVWAFHGTADKTVPAERTREMEAALRAAGAGEFHATYHEGVGHDSWTRTYANPAVYAWMMRHRR
jgi:predicted peptidase